MNVLHIVSGSIHGGAARGAYAIHSALIRKGINSRLLLSQDEIIEDPSIVQIELEVEGAAKREYRLKLDRFSLKCYPDQNTSDQRGRIFSTGVAGINLEELPQYKEADIIHLHWVNRLISIEDIGKITKPIVWTMHDLWPFTGGCHLNRSCHRFKIGCGVCPELSSNDVHDLSSVIVKRKLSNLGDNVFPVAVSSWTREYAQQSVVFKDKQVQLIPNCADTEEFAPIPKEDARTFLGLPIDKKIILFGAVNSIHDRNKGFIELVQALNQLSNKNDCFLAIFGSSPKTNHVSITEVGMEYKLFGHIHDDHMLSALYCAADVFVAPSLQETFGRTIIEAMACERPVVAFNSTGPKEIISHQVTGYLAQPYEADDLRQGIEWILALDEQAYDQMSRQCRQAVLEKYSYDKIADQYVSLYKNVTSIHFTPKLRGVSECKPNRFETLTAHALIDIESHIIAKLRQEIETGDPLDFQETASRLFLAYLDSLHHQEAKISLWDYKRLFPVLKQAIASKREIAIFGSGTFGRRVHKQMTDLHIPVTCYVDNDSNKWGQHLDGVEIVSLHKAQQAFFLIASSWHAEIKDQLIKSGRKQLLDFVIVI